MTIIREGTQAAKILGALRALPPGTSLTTLDLAKASGMARNQVLIGTRLMLPMGYIKRGRDVVDARRLTWSLGDVHCEIQERRHAFERRAVIRRGADDATRKQFCEEVPEPILVTKLRDLYFIGNATATGEPLRLLADALQAARKVLDARGTTRFPGAEVERFVGREIRGISEAILNATRNLTEALETTL